MAISNALVPCILLFLFALDGPSAQQKPLEPQMGEVLTPYDAGSKAIASPSGGADHALFFDGPMRQEVDVGLVVAPGNQYTAEAWIRQDRRVAAGADNGAIVGQHASHIDAKGTLDIIGGRLRFLVNTHADGSFETRHDSLSSRNLLPVGVWTHVAGVYDGTSMIVYINGFEEGRLEKSGDITQYNHRRSTRIGGYAGTAMDFPGWFHGEIDEVRIWSVARTRDQLQRDMHRVISPQSGLIGYWRFDEGQGSTTKDWSGNGHNGQLTNYLGDGAPTWTTGVFGDLGAPPADFSVSLDLDPQPGDQGLLLRFGVGPDSVVGVQVFATAIQGMVGFGARVIYDADQLSFENFEPGDAIPDAHSPGAILGAGFVEISAASLGGVVEAQEGMVGTVFFRASGSFSAATVGVDWMEIRRDGRFERLDLDLQVEIRATPSADFDGDGFVGFRDFLLFAEAFGTRSGDDGFDLG